MAGAETGRKQGLMMDAHGALGAFKCLHSQKAKPPGKAPLLYPPKVGGPARQREEHLSPQPLVLRGVSRRTS